ncbi:preprotein translocase subunit YajC [Pseudofrankia sp. DC12]|uniref:preprotein translocase subunit YajC n=1 Tax=Pseudofrankia sp. DC12 TaxID=683315 RepID=UPI0005F7E3E0|nr:preprotein translocase subunit YajC [Pseudofrankia sp. DC12]
MHLFAAAAIAANDEAASKSSGGFGSWLLPLLIVLVGVYFFTMQRRRQRAAQSEQSKLGPGTLVMTRSGLYGTIVETDGEDILLEIAPDVVCRFNRGAVGRVISSPDTAGVPEEDTAVSFEKDAESPADDAPAAETPADEQAVTPEAPEASKPPKKDL